MRTRNMTKVTSQLIPILSAGNEGCSRIDEDVLLIQGILSPQELNEYVILESSMYRVLFGEKKIASSRSRKRLSIVKISYEGRSIHRAYRSISARDFTKDYVGLTPASIYELSDGNVIPALSKVTLSKGCWWNFYWEHPNAAVRISFIMGVIGITISILLSIIGCIVSNI